MKNKNTEGSRGNIVLIGMPASGKSTLGVLLAKTLGMNFLDTDLLMQRKEEMLLQDIVDERGIEGFLSIEEEILKDLNVEATVISTGGSAVYSQDGMKNLKSLGKIIYIKVDFPTIDERLHNIKSRGVVLGEKQTLEDLYNERCPLYEEWAHVVFESQGRTVEECVEELQRGSFKNA